MTNQEIQDSLPSHYEDLTRESIALKIKQIELTIAYTDSIIEWCSVVSDLNDTHIIVDWNVIEEMLEG